MGIFFDSHCILPEPSEKTTGYRHVPSLSVSYTFQLGPREVFADKSSITKAAKSPRSTRGRTKAGLGPEALLIPKPLRGTRQR